MFETIKHEVNNAFYAMLAIGDLYEAGVEKGVLFEAYLNALPETARQEHNCHCCRHFLNNYGNLVTIHGGQVKTLWEFSIGGDYKKVPDALDAIVRAAPITNIFVSQIAHLGTDSNTQRLESGGVIRWKHFHAVYPSEKLLRGSESVESVIGNANGKKQVFERALKELTLDATNTVLELISQNSLYRGAEFKSSLLAFRQHQASVVDYSPEAISLYAWEKYRNAPADIRNSAIGTLLVDLSEGRELTAAVASYEAKVAPANYRRPTALVTKGMLEKAEKELTNLGLDKALYRRHATADDIPVSEVLFVNRSVGDTGGGLFDTLKEDVAVNPKSFDRIEEIGIDKFISDVLPTATGVEVLFENRHAGNLMNLTAAVNADAPSLFPWDSGVAWVYKDGNADSVRERVKAAGGSIEGELRISLDWYNFDDLDLHVIEPNGNHICFSNKYARNGNGGLDVDMNAGTEQTRTPVENIIFKSKDEMDDGFYRVYVNNYRKREGIDGGFGIEIECRGEVINLFSEKSPASGANIEVASIAYSKKAGIDVAARLESKGAVSKELYGIGTNKFHKVSMMLPSPNYWAGRASGNLHTFFVLDKARTDAPIRGFFNEFLKPELRDHRKVFELLGEKVKVLPNGPQLTGLGFSSTQHTDLICRVSGNFTRIVKIKF